MLLLSLVDFVLFAFLAAAPEHRQQNRGLRVEYDLDGLTATDLVLVGDSFVWGQGVGEDQRFGNRLEARFGGEGLSTRVYSLGLLGAGPIQYASLLKQIPESITADRVIVAYYLNDMPMAESLLGKIQSVTGSLGYGFLSLRFVGDKIAALLVPGVDEYHALVIDSYARDGPSHDKRWALLERQLTTVQQLAASRSQEKPLFLILPIMVDFHDYPLQAAHERLAALASSIGFEPFDLYPVFLDNLWNGEQFLVAPDDNHFNAQVHDFVARVLFDRLNRERGTDAALP